MRILTEYEREIYAVLAVCAIIVLAFLFGRAYITGTTADDPCPGDQMYTNTCWGAYYEDLAHERGALTALHDLKRRYDKGGYARSFCHGALHKIGTVAADEFGTIAEAYKRGDTFCRAGYYHGVLEKIFGEADEGGGAELLSTLNSICAGIAGKSRYSYAYFACVHGIGHGLMAYFNHDVFQSLAGCKTLRGNWEQGSCHGGVFMENVTADSPEMPSKYLKGDDPLYPCTAVADEYRYTCYQFQTSYMLKIFGGDFARTFDTCRAVEEKYRNVCFQSLGRDASGWSYGSGEAALANCSFGTADERTHCLIGAAIDFIQSVGHDEARALCDAGEESARAPCAQAVDWHIRAI